MLTLAGVAELMAVLSPMRLKHIKAVWGEEGSEIVSESLGEFKAAVDAQEAALPPPAPTGERQRYAATLSTACEGP